MKQATTRELYSFWSELRGERAAPDRSEVEPAGIAALLNDAFMLGNEAEAGFPIRLAGTRISELFMCELRGLPFLNLFADPDRDSLRALLDSVIDDPTPIVVGLKAAPVSREAMDIELLLLPLGPLRSPQGRILGSFAASARPSWRGLIAVEPLRLTSLRILQQTQARPFGNMSIDISQWSTLPQGQAGKSTKVPLRQANLTLYT